MGRHGPTARGSDFLERVDALAIGAESVHEMHFGPVGFLFGEFFLDLVVVCFACW